MSISPVNVSNSTNPNYAKRNELMRKRNKAVAYALPSIGLALAGGLPWAVGAKFAEKNKIVLSALAAIGVVGTVIAGIGYIQSQFLFGIVRYHAAISW